MPLRTEDIAGYDVCRDTQADIVDCVAGWLNSDARECHYFACLNPHAAEVAADDIKFTSALRSADFLTADGVGIVYASRVAGGTIRKRTTGMDVFLAVSELMNDLESRSCFFLGSSEETLDKITEHMAEAFPKIRIAGTYSPPFKAEFSPEDNLEMIAAVNKASPDVLWVGLTAPKQEKWIYEHQAKLDVKFAGPIGAVFDFMVGNINRAGPFWQDLGLEWLPRLIQEPRRLWRRSLVSAPRFLLRTARYQRSQKRGGNQ